MKRSALNRKTPLRARTPMRQVSERTAKRNRRYKSERLPFLDARPLCEICGVNRSTEVHHKAGRGVVVFFDQSQWLAVCHDCHVFVTHHPDEARRNGWSVHTNGAA